MLISTLPGALAFATSLLATQAVALALPGKLQERSTYPFEYMVAFGDELSDNGNGSYAHGITGNPANVYGFGTWTNGPVAVSYLADLLSVTLTDYAYGASDGGSNFGATVDNAYTPSPANAQSLKQQIANYTSQPVGSGRHFKNSLQFIWIGENDLSAHTDAFWEGDPHNAWFAGNISSRTAESVSTLLAAGTPYVFVANIYPKHVAPVTAAYLCGTSTSCVSTWGSIISAANTAIESALTQFGSQVIYYDVYSFMLNLIANKDEYGLTAPTTDYCDGDASSPNDHWTDCMVDGHADQYYWMSFVNPTTRVHELIAGDMKRRIDGVFGV